VSEVDSLGSVMERALSVCAHTLGVERVGVWLMRDAERCIECIHLLDTAHPDERPGEKLPIEDMGAYCSALTDRPVLLVSDATTHPATIALVPRYLAPKRISALVDAPLYRDGRPIGVVCVEHRGGARTWSDDDVTFVLSMADVVAQLFVSQELRATEAELLDREQALAHRVAAEAMLRLSRTIAHDLNSALTVVLGAAGTLEHHGGDAKVAAATAAELRAAVRDANLLTRKLLNYADLTPTASPTSLDAILGRVEPRLRELAGESRTLDLSRGAGPTEVAIAEPQLVQLLEGLVCAAREATGPGGRISLSSQRALRGALLLVTDDGELPDEHTSARLLAPCSSTHEAAVGVVSGRSRALKLAADLLREAGGSVELEVTPDSKTCVRVRLPLPAPLDVTR